MFSIAAFYHFFPVQNTINLQRKFFRFFENTQIKGTVLIASEGVNGTVAGTEDEIADYKAFLNEIFEQQTFSFKVAQHDSIPFGKLKVKIKEEIVAIKCDLRSTPGLYVSPYEWAEFIASPNVVTIDTRNDYEYTLGTFKGALNPCTRSFRQFPEWVQRHLQSHNKDDLKIAMFCTGGIRCEKSTRLMKDLGFEKVYHLEGGILNYFEKTQNVSGAWIGTCFVFDDRIAVDQHQQAISLN